MSSPLTFRRVLTTPAHKDYSRKDADSAPMIPANSIEVTITIDLDQLFDTLGRAAASNKTRRAIEGGGSIVAKASK